jgi:cobalt/nickel transport system permease protein
MHMSDALISPVVGGVFWSAMAGGVAWSARRVARAGDERRVPLMGVLGAFVFAAQMVNFSIPGTGSSGHLGGGLLLAVLLGADAGLLVMASILVVQALLFADGGLLALGCNVVNMGFATCYLAYPLVFRPLAGKSPGRARLFVASLTASILGLQLGALGVVGQTAISGQVGLPLGAFLLAMQPIHLAIGIVEGLVTAVILQALWRARPDLATSASPQAAGSTLLRAALGLGVAAALVAGILSRFASTNPDGLEWSLSRTLGSFEVRSPGIGLHATLAHAQSATAIFPDYTCAGARAASTAGLIGAAATLAIALALGLLLRGLRRRSAAILPAADTEARCP